MRQRTEMFTKIPATAGINIKGMGTGRLHLPTVPQPHQDKVVAEVSPSPEISSAAQDRSRGNAASGGWGGGGHSGGFGGGGGWGGGGGGFGGGGFGGRGGGGFGGRR